MSEDTHAPERSEDSGALKKLAEDPASRRRFLTMVGGTGAATAFATFLAACGSSDDSKTTSSTTGSTATDTGTAQFGKGDIGIVNYALTLEYLETAFYKDVVASGLFKGSQQDLLKSFGEQEAEHVTALTAAVKQLGGTPAPVPNTKFPLTDAKSVAALAATVENLGAAAYLGQAGNIQSKEILAAALSIHTVEARHASALNTLTDQTITPDGAFAKPTDAATVLKSVQPFIVA